LDSARPAATNRGRRPGPATIAALQRSAGNAAVTALLSAPAVQRAIGDGHDLASPRFAGVPILEACFDNQARLREGDGGDPVIRVQQALVDLGADLGPTGADGTYGPKTAAAVRKFKADENLGSEQFGDVGPGTIGRLDELFAQDKPATPGGSKMDVGDTDDAVEEPSSCPSPVELESEIGAGGATESVVTTQALTDTVTAPAADAAGPTPIGATNLDSAVRDFANRLDVPTVGPDDPGNVSAGGHAGREVGDPGDHDPPAVHRCVRGRRKDRKWVVDPAQQDQLDPSVAHLVSLASYRRMFEFDATACGNGMARAAARVRARGGPGGKSATGRPVVANMVAGPMIRDRRRIGTIRMFGMCSRRTSPP